MSERLTTAQARLAAAQARKRRADLGPPLTLSAVDLDVLTNVGPTDQAEALAFARDAAGQRAVDMLGAER
jgi:hypothetical protein